MSLIFYDTETSGLSSAFDQILQFAAIRTDDDLKETGRFEIRSRLLPYIVPSPRAMQVTGQTIDDLLDDGRPSHYEMVTALRRELGAWCPAAFIGYNSMRFDEEFLRQAFYQCLHPPYLTNTGGSRRADAMHLIRVAALLHPEALVIPTGENGRPTFKLDRLAPANGFDHLNAHDALADVEALIHLCRLVRDRCPALWRRFVQFARKDGVATFVRREDAFVVMEIGPTTTNPFVVTAIGENAGQSNLVYGYDLTVDPQSLRELSDCELAAKLVRPSRPIRKIKKNAAPMLCPLEEATEVMLEGLTPAEAAHRGRLIRADRPLVRRLITASSGSETAYPLSPYYEKQIYAGFWSNEDAAKLDDFHNASWSRRAEIAEELEDPRLKWLARRLIFVGEPDVMHPDHRAEMAKLKAKRMLAGGDDNGGWMTVAKAMAALSGEDATSGNAETLRFADYLNARRDEATRLID